MVNKANGYAVTSETYSFIIKGKGSRYLDVTSEIKWLCVDVDGCKIVNVYKPVPKRLRSLDLSMFPHPCLYAGDFN